eukprot:GEMP01007710.1.p1 GENE.GEMP01007710.1~~GEMP01007710.1.p1  ORF type:complete len:601 (+),score=121.05 GEMP01007710.1:81-1883(+)
MATDKENGAVDTEHSKEPGKDNDIDAYKKRKIAQVQIENLGRAGGVYVPPFKLARLQAEIEDKTSKEYQRQTWEALRKSVNGLVNKLNVDNVRDLVPEIFQENLIRGRGLLCRAIIRAQMASPGFTHIYACLASVLNSKLPEVGDLLLRRIILQFRRSYKRNDKIVLSATAKFLAHLVNQKVCSEVLALQVCMLFLENITSDSIEVCVIFVQECGAALEEIMPAGARAIFDRLRHVMQEDSIDERVQYIIESLLNIRRRKFVDHPAIPDELDLVEEEDQVTHEFDLLEDECKGEEMLNIFRPQEPSQYVADEEKWKGIARDILNGDVHSSGDDESSSDSEAEPSAPDAVEEKAKQVIKDRTEQDLVNLRRTLYLSFVSAAHFEECVHKIMKMNIDDGQEKEVITMLIDCCAMERTFSKYHALIADRLCRIKPAYQEELCASFNQQLATVHRLETNKLRNIAKFFALLLSSDALSWELFSVLKMTEDTTTSSSRIFIKIMFQEMANDLGMRKLNDRLKDPDCSDWFTGIFPRDHPRNIKFSINFFTAIGLGGLTEDLRLFLEKCTAELVKEVMEESSSSSSSSSDSDSDSDSSSSSSSSSD